MYGYGSSGYHLPDANFYTIHPYYTQALQSEGSVVSSIDDCPGCALGGEGSLCEHHASSQLTVPTDVDSQPSNELDDTESAQGYFSQSEPYLANGGNNPVANFQWNVQQDIRQEPDVANIASQGFDHLQFMGPAMGAMEVDSLSPQRMENDLVEIGSAESHHPSQYDNRARTGPRPQSGLLVVQQALPGLRRRRSSSAQGTKSEYACPEEGCNHTFAKRTDLGRHLDGATHGAIKYYCPAIFPDGTLCSQEFVGRPDNLERHLRQQHHWSIERAKAHVAPFNQQAQARWAAIQI